ncbi:hypothetical protein PoB_001791300 [Plakobranchus ocellatus]|uniref:Uncharacterized protein n=1 Tax=Plakobranchus ocellatus TaxID=259542 RepID=A0AAV3Z9X0_9GAST|nr:hypothetical protein PoB_001791300 [Plakobranchus ocellatus]
MVTAAAIVNDVKLREKVTRGGKRLSSPPSGQGAGARARTHDRRVPADLRADFLATEPTWCLCISPETAKLFSPHSGPTACNGARTRNRRIPVDHSEFANHCATESS